MLDTITRIPQREVQQTPCLETFAGDSMPFSGGSSVPVMRSAVGFTPPGPRMPPGALPLFLLLVPPGGGGVSLTPEAAPKPLDQVLSTHQASDRQGSAWRQTSPTAVLKLCTRTRALTWAAPTSGRTAASTSSCAAANVVFHNRAAPEGEGTAAGVSAAGIGSFLGGLDSTTGRPCSTM